MSRIGLAAAGAMLALPIAVLPVSPADAVVVQNQMVQVYSCAINIPGGNCYAWYQYPYNGWASYNPAVGNHVCCTQRVYNRYQF